MNSSSPMIFHSSSYLLTFLLKLLNMKTSMFEFQNISSGGLVQIMQAYDNWATVVCRFIFALTAIFSNSLIIYTIQRFPRLRCKAYNGLIGILAFADFLVGEFGRQPGGWGHTFWPLLQLSSLREEI